MLTTLNIGTSKGNITGAKFNKPFTDIRYDDILNYVRNKSNIEVGKGFSLIGWAKVSEEDFTIPEFIRITQFNAWQGQGNYSNLTDGSVHEVVHFKGLENTESGLYVMGVSHPVRVLSDEYSALWPIGKDGKSKKGKKFTAKEIEKIRKNFEKSQLESKKIVKFVSSVNSLNKNKNMSNTAKGQLTKTEMQVMEAIASATGKKTSHKSLIGKEANLSEVDTKLSGIDTAKVARKMKRAGLLTYEWQTDKAGDRTGERLIALTQEGFDAVQLGVKEPKPKKASSKKDTKKASSKKDTKKASSKNKPALQGVPGDEAEEPTYSEGFSIKMEPKAKTFFITSQYGKHALKVKSASAFKTAKAYTEDEWLTRIENGELTEIED